MRDERSRCGDCAGDEKGGLEVGLRECLRGHRAAGRNKLTQGDHTIEHPDESYQRCNGAGKQGSKGIDIVLKKNIVSYLGPGLDADAILDISHSENPHSPAGPSDAG